jgi:hypothetical protein
MWMMLNGKLTFTKNHHLLAVCSSGIVRILAIVQLYP